MLFLKKMVLFSSNRHMKSDTTLLQQTLIWHLSSVWPYGNLLHSLLLFRKHVTKNSRLFFYVEAPKVIYSMWNKIIYLSDCGIFKTVKGEKLKCPRKWMYCTFWALHNTEIRKKLSHTLKTLHLVDKMRNASFFIIS